MSNLANVRIHSSQFPEQVQRDLLESLRRRAVNHKFHYDSIKQTQKWLALHEAYSPARQDPNCLSVYDAAFAGTIARLHGMERVHVVGLGCGGGQKDVRLLELLIQGGAAVTYTPVDVGVPMVLTARQHALTQVAPERCFPTVCDLATVEDIAEIVPPERDEDMARLITFFGMIPNFEPNAILPRLAQLVRHGDFLLFSANLAPGPDYDRGVERVLPQYDNPPTRDWLGTFLFDLGVEPDDGELLFRIENDPAGTDLKRIAASFVFRKRRSVRVFDEAFSFAEGDAVRLFFSYRLTLPRAHRLLEQHGLVVVGEWITTSEEEGVFLCRR